MFLIDLEQALEIYFTVNDWRRLKKFVVFIFDNSSIHLSDSVHEFFKKRGLLAFTLPAYTPSYNPIELMF